MPTTHSTTHPHHKKEPITRLIRDVIWPVIVLSSFFTAVVFCVMVEAGAR